MTLLSRCFSVGFDCAFIYFQNGHFGECVWDGVRRCFRKVSDQFQTSFGPGTRPSQLQIFD